jgi:hypothetical protein
MPEKKCQPVFPIFYAQKDIFLKNAHGKVQSSPGVSSRDNGPRRVWRGPAGHKRGKIYPAANL